MSCPAIKPWQHHTAVNSEVPYSNCPATCSCFPSSHKKDTLMLMFLSLFDSHTHTHRWAALLKATEKKQAAFVLLLWSGADVSEVGSHGWLGATKALVSWHYPAPQMLSRPAAVSACVCVCSCCTICPCPNVTSGWSCHLSLGGQREKERERESHKEGGNLSGSECWSSLALVVCVGGHIKL